jgi:polyisoprenoid-binding protein YceI
MKAERFILLTKPIRWFFLRMMMSLMAVELSAVETVLVVDKANSRIEISVKATVDSFVGKLTDYFSTVRFDPDTGKVTAAKIVFHFNDVKTGNERRDREMHVWQQTEKFPDGDFTLGALDASAEGKLTARGTLTFHGVTHALEFPVTITREGSGLTVEGEAVVDTRLYGLPVIRKFALLKVDPLVGVHFHLSGAMAVP